MFWNGMKTKSSRRGTTILAEPRIASLRSNPSTLMVDFEDGRSVHLPLLWFPRLFRATQAQRDRYELMGNGYGVHWPDVDEDLSAAGLLVGRPSVEYVPRSDKLRKAQKKVA